MDDNEASVTVSDDRAIEKPENDLFGFAPFANHLANSICSIGGHDGMVIALYGPWGSGKTSVLNLVRHYISLKDDRPIVTIFNPWWFSGQEDIAKAFLGHLGAALPDKLRAFKKIKSLLGDFSSGIGILGDVFGYSAIGKIVGLLKPKSRDVPSIKQKIVEALKKQNKRVLILVDDIDRLTPDDLRQLFKAIKALADFPNVVYLIALDKEIATKALSVSQDIDGLAYLEKIIQVPFDLPSVEKSALRSALFKKLNPLFADIPESKFDSTYWGNVFYEGIDHFIKIPRDIVRLTNALSLNWKMVKGEVNPVDFIAIEVLRVFSPKAYDAIRSNPEYFAGHTGSLEVLKPIKVFHEVFINTIQEDLREPTKALLMRLFPKVKGSLSNTTYGSAWESDWRRDLRICDLELFPVYFRLSVSAGAVTKQEIDFLISADRSMEDIASLLLASARTFRPDGTSKVRSVLERLFDHVAKDIPDDQVLKFVTSLLSVGDQLIIPQDENRSFFDFGNESRVSRIVYSLLMRRDQGQRLAHLLESMKTAHALSALCVLVQSIEHDKDGANSIHGGPLILEPEVIQLKREVAALIRRASLDASLIASPRLSRILYCWKNWESEDAVRDWVATVISSDTNLILLLTSFVQYPMSQTLGDAVGRVGFRLNPKSLSPFADIGLLEKRSKRLLEDGVLDAHSRKVLLEFQKGCELLADGKDPDSYSHS